MNTKDKKKEIIKTLEQSDDAQLIEEVYELLHPSEAVEDVKLNQLPEELQEKLQRGLDDYENGRYISHNEIRQKAQQWLTQ